MKTEINTTEGNKLIAEFMGYAKRHIDYTDADQYKIGRWVYEADLLYHSSWDWLMPVVEKIEYNGAKVVIGRMSSKISYTDPLNDKKQFDITIASGVKINHVNGAVIEFITWYNENYK